MNWIKANRKYLAFGFLIGVVTIPYVLFISAVSGVEVDATGTSGLEAWFLSNAGEILGTVWALFLVLSILVFISRES